MKPFFAVSAVVLALAAVAFALIGNERESGFLAGMATGMLLLGGSLIARPARPERNHRSSDLL